MRRWTLWLAILAALTLSVGSAVTAEETPWVQLADRAGFDPLVPTALSGGLGLHRMSLLPKSTGVPGRGIWLWYRVVGSDLVLVESRLPLSVTGSPAARWDKVVTFSWPTSGGLVEEGLLRRHGVYILVAGRGLSATRFRRLMASVAPEGAGLWHAVLHLFRQR